MEFAENVTVAEIAAASLAAVRVFEKHGIDYCCGGKRPLAAVCREKGKDESAVRSDLNVALAGANTNSRDWSTAPFNELIEHIVTTHHDYLRRELPAIEVRLEKVHRVYNQRYGPTLTGLPQVFEALTTELLSHLWKEENILFPAILAGRGPVTGPITVMEAEHESAGRALEKIREITNNFSVPEYGCVTYRALMSSLDELERDLHLHIHLENNILFPRAASRV